MSDASAGSTDDIWVLVMGHTGSGKSTFIQHLTGNQHIETNLSYISGKDAAQLSHLH